jgi:hypothetical protein
METITTASSTLTLSSRLLQHIASMVTEGDPIWGLLWANQYLAKDSGLRKALVTQARKRPHAVQCEPLFDQVAEGKSFQELTLTEQTQVMSSTTTHAAQKRRYVIRKRFEISDTRIKARGAEKSLRMR